MPTARTSSHLLPALPAHPQASRSTSRHGFCNQRQNNISFFSKQVELRQMIPGQEARIQGCTTETGYATTAEAGQ